MQIYLRGVQGFSAWQMGKAAEKKAGNWNSIVGMVAHSIFTFMSTHQVAQLALKGYDWRLIVLSSALASAATMTIPGEFFFPLSAIVRDSYLFYKGQGRMDALVGIAISVWQCKVVAQGFNAERQNLG